MKKTHEGRYYGMIVEKSLLGNLKFKKLNILELFELKFLLAKQTKNCSVRLCVKRCGKCA